MAEKIKGLSVGLSLDDLELQQGLTGLKRRLATMNAEMKSSLSAFDRGEKSVQKYETRLESLNKKLEVQKRVTEEARKQYEKMVEENKLGTLEGEKAAREYHNQAAALNNLERYIVQTTKELEKLRKEQAFQESGWGKLSANLDSVSKKMTKTGETLTGIGKDMSTKVTTPIVAGGVAIFKAASNYESAFAGVRKTVDMSEAGLAKLSKGIRDMAKELPSSAEEIAGVAEAAGQLGIKNESILGFTRTIIDLGESTNLSLEQAGSQFARFANIVGMSQDDFDRLGSSVVALGNNMATTESEIMEMAMRLAAQGSQVGMTEAQIAALAATMSSLGIEAEAGGTAMTTVLKKIQSAVDEGGKELEGFAAAAGVSSSEFAKVWKEQPIQALDMFIKGLAKSSGEGKNLTTILDDLGIKGIRESDTILRMAGASDLLSEAVKTSSDAWEENTALTNEAEQRYKTTESQLKMLWNRIKDVGITLGEALIPAVMDAIDAAEPLFNMIEKGAKSFSEMSKEEQQTILKTVGLVAALGPLSFGLGSVFKIIGTVSGGMSKLIGRIGKVSIEMGGATKSVGLLGSTTKASSGSLKGLSGATATAGKNLPKFTGLLGKAGGAIRGLGSLAPVAGRGLMSLAGPFGLLATVAIPELIKGGISLVNHLKEDSIPALNDFGDNVSEATAEAVLGYKKLNDEATTQLNQLLWSQEEITPEIAENLTSTFSEMGGQIKESLKADFDESYKTLSNFFTNSKTLSKDEQQAILDNMKAKQDEQQKAVADSEARIKEIMDKASQEKRALTQAEKDEINQIQQEMMATAIQTMSNGEVEQKAILERLKQESGNITALQAAETVQNSLKAKEGAIKEANQKYDEVVKWAIRERDESGSITAEQADKIIKDAARQRDESIKKAEEMHNGVVEQAKKQAKGQVDEIDWSTGEVLSNWDKMVRGVAKAVNAVSGGVNWVLDKIGVDKKIPEWKPKGYAIGTPSTGHPGGPAIVGEKGPELAYVPGQGITLLGAKGPELHTNLPKGTAVLPNKETERMLKSYGFPGYENGVGDFFKWALEGPKKLMGKVWEKFPIPDFNVGGSLKDMGKGIVNFLKDNVFEYVKKKIKDFFSFDSGSTGNIGQWIGKAIAITGVPASWFNPLVTIAKHESGGNPRAINRWDINAKRGIPSQGLMQTVPPTFNAYKLPGLDDILNPVHNAVAAINYIKARYGNVFNVPGIKSLARGGKYIGYATGGIVKNDGLYRLAEEGWPEFVIPTAPNRRTEAMKLLALAGKEIGNKRPNQLPNVTSDGNNSQLEKIIGKLSEQVEDTKQIVSLLTKLLLKDTAISIDGRELAYTISPYVKDYINFSENRFRGGAS